MHSHPKIVSSLLCRAFGNFLLSIKSDSVQLPIYLTLQHLLTGRELSNQQELCRICMYYLYSTMCRHNYYRLTFQAMLRVSGEGISRQRLLGVCCESLSRELSRERVGPRGVCGWHCHLVRWLWMCGAIPLYRRLGVSVTEGMSRPIAAVCHLVCPPQRRVSRLWSW